MGMRTAGAHTPAPPPRVGPATGVATGVSAARRVIGADGVLAPEMLIGVVMRMSAKLSSIASPLAHLPVGGVVLFSYGCLDLKTLPPSPVLYLCCSSFS